MFQTREQHRSLLNLQKGRLIDGLSYKVENNLKSGDASLKVSHKSESNVRNETINLGVITPLDDLVIIAVNKLFND